MLGGVNIHAIGVAERSRTTNIHVVVEVPVVHNPLLIVQEGRRGTLKISLQGKRLDAITITHGAMRVLKANNV